jgi:hypothetical protein
MFICQGAETEVPATNGTTPPAKGVKPRQRVAAITLSLLMERCSATLKTYVADAPLRGMMPFPRWVALSRLGGVPKNPINACLFSIRNREREEELAYVLNKLAWLELEEGTLLAADADDPTRSLDKEAAAGEAGGIPGGAAYSTTRERVGYELARTSGAHLLRLYPLLIELLGISFGRRRTIVRRAPEAGSGMQQRAEDGELMGELVRRCLEQVGDSVVV